MVKRFLGFGIVEITPFSDADFTLNTAGKVTIGLSQQDAEDEAMLEISKETDTLVRANGVKDVYTKPNKKSGVLTINVVNPLPDDLIALILPDSQKIVDNVTPTKTRTEIFDQIGLLLSDWQNAVQVVHKPVDADENPLSPQFWTTLRRAVIVPQIKGSASAKPGKTKLEFIGIGGLDGTTRIAPVTLGDLTATP
jgi:hypothetical protein